MPALLIDHAAVLKMHGEGETIPVIAEKLGASANGIRYLLDKHFGHEGPHRTGRNRIQIDRELVVQLRAAGGTFKAIAERVGCSEGHASAIYAEWLRDNPPVPVEPVLVPVEEPIVIPRLSEELGIRICEYRQHYVADGGIRVRVISLPFVSILDGVPA